MAGNVVWAAPISEVANSESSSGGKGGPPKQTSVSFSYFLTMDVDLCEGPIVGVRRVWMNDELYVDLTAPTSGAPLNIRIYTGSETQLPDPDIEAIEGIGNVPASRGKAHVVIKDFPLARSGNAVPVFHFEVVVAGSSAVAVQTITDTGASDGVGSIAVDEETGLVWVARGSADEVRVFSVSGALTLVKTIEKRSASTCAWCPAFLSIRQSLVSPNFIQNPARMWVASSFPDGLSDSALIGYSTDGAYRELISISPFGSSLFCWPGAIIVDKSSISQVFPNQNQVTVGLVGVTNGACGGIRAFQLDDTTPKASASFQGYAFQGNNYVSDWVEGEQDVIYTMDFGAVVYKMQKGVPNAIFIDPEEIAAEYYITSTALTTALTPFKFGRNTVTYDPDAEAVYTRGIDASTQQVEIRKYDSDLNLIWSTTYLSAGGAFLPDAVRYHPGVGDVWLFGEGSVNGVGAGFLHAVRISAEDGSIIDDLVTTITDSVDAVTIYPGSPFAIVTTTNAVHLVPLVPGATPSAPTLRDVMTRFALRTDDLTAADIDVTDIPITDVVTGYAIPRRMPVSNAIRPLLLAYFVDIVEKDGKVAFVKRGGSSIVTIPKEDLSARGFGQALPSPTVYSRTQDNELPRELDVRFINGDDQFKSGAEPSQRLTTGSFQVRTEDLPIVFSPDEAKQIADTLLYNSWNDRDPRDIVVSRKYLQVTPTDIITIEDPDQGEIVVRVNRVEYHFPQLLKMQVVFEDITVYSGFTFPGSVPLADLPSFPAVANLRLFVLDIPNLRDADNNIGVYIGAYAASGDYQSGEVFRSLDGITFISAAALANESSVSAAEDPLTWTGSFK
ncbi:MAG: phage tail protein [Dehalococcoidales bacterium]